MALPAAESTQPAVLAAATAVAPANTETPPTAAALSVTLACAQSLTGEDGGQVSPVSFRPISRIAGG